jgi:hypothetical protein
LYVYARHLFLRKYKYTWGQLQKGIKIASPRKRIFGRELCKINKHKLTALKYSVIGHFNVSWLAKVVYHRNLFYFFVKYLYTHLGNTLLIDDIFHKTCMNPPFNVMFVESFRHKDVNDNYLVGNILPYLESLHYFRFNVSMFVQENLFGTIKNVLFFFLSIVIGYSFFYRHLDWVSSKDWHKGLQTMWCLNFHVFWMWMKFLQC